MKNLTAILGKDELRPMTTHLVLTKDYVYATNSFALVKVKKDLIPYLNHNVEFGDKEELTIHHKELKGVKGNLVSSTDKEFQWELKKQITKARVVKQENKFADKMDSLIKSKMAKSENKKGWNVEGAMFDPKELSKVSEVLKEVLNSDVADFNLNVVNGTAIITHNELPTDKFMGFLQGLNVRY